MPPRLRRSPLFWGGLLVSAFIIFAWAQSYRYTLVASRGHNLYGTLDLEIRSAASAITVHSRHIAATRPAFPPAAPAPWDWATERVKRSARMPLLPRPAWVRSHQTGALLVDGPSPGPLTLEYRTSTDLLDFTLPYWLILAIVLPVWLLLLHRRGRRLRKIAVAL